MRLSSKTPLSSHGVRSNPDSRELLRRELARPGYRPAPLALGANTDPYQPFERQRGLTWRILEVLAEDGFIRLRPRRG